jgi:hypothetical protein
VFLLNIDNDVDTVLDTPGSADLDRNFATMEMHYYHDRCPISFTTILPRCTPRTVLALPASLPITLALREQQNPPPAHTILHKVNQAHHPNALYYIDTTNIIFGHLRQAIRQQQELCNIATAIVDDATAPAWSLD